MILLATAGTVTDEVSVAQVVMSGIMLAMMALATTLVVTIRGTSKRTEDAVHTSDGTSVSDQLTRLEGRVAGNEARMTQQAVRIDRNDQSIAAAHRRIDSTVGELANLKVNHGGRLAAAETSIKELQHQEMN